MSSLKTELLTKIIHNRIMNCDANTINTKGKTCHDGAALTPMVPNFVLRQLQDAKRALKIVTKK